MPFNHQALFCFLHVCYVWPLPSCLLKLSIGAARILICWIFVCSSNPASSEKLTAHRQNKSQIQNTHLAAHRKTKLRVLLFLCSPWAVISKLSSHYTEIKTSPKSSRKQTLKWYLLFTECYSASKLEYWDQCWFCLDKLWSWMCPYSSWW